jgi:hypothetical protein
MTFDIADKSARRIRDRAQTVAEKAKDALDSGLAIAGERARTYADRGVIQLERARSHLPRQMRRPSMTMVVTALGAGLLLGLLVSGKARGAISDLSGAGKDAIRRRRLTNLSH